MSDTLENPQIKLKIEILLKEYDTLRAEIFHRINARFAVVGLMGGLLAFLLSQDGLHSGSFPGTVRWIACAGGGLTIIVLWLRLGVLINKIGSHIKSIERRINELVGEELMTWESRYGWGRLKR